MCDIQGIGHITINLKQKAHFCNIQLKNNEKRH